MPTASAPPSTPATTEGTTAITRPTANSRFARPVNTSGLTWSRRHVSTAYATAAASAAAAAITPEPVGEHAPGQHRGGDERREPAQVAPHPAIQAGVLVVLLLEDLQEHVEPPGDDRRDGEQRERDRHASARK